MNQNKKKAWRGVWLYRRLYHQLFLKKFPPILSNSFQKAGTHLLLGAVSNLPHYGRYGRQANFHYLERARVVSRKIPTVSTVIQRFQHVFPGEVFKGHICAHPEIVNFLDRSDFRHLFIYRDLRDVVVSMFFGWKKNEGVIDTWPFRYFQSLPSDHDRIQFVISGWPINIPSGDFPGEVDYPNIGERFLENLPWLSNKNCLALQFENLAPSDKRQKTLEDIANYLVGEHITSTERDMMVLAMEEGCNPANSKTFRKGTGGEWKEYFTKEHKKSFKDIAGQILIDLGYEKDFDW
jgi:hypothetical protein